MARCGEVVFLVLFCASLGFLTDGGETTKNILLYNPLVGPKKWVLRNGFEDQSYFKSLNCPATNCYVTTNRTFLKNIRDYDMIAIHALATTISDDVYVSPPEDRRPGQLFVIYFREAPDRTKRFIGSESSFYNWTMSYGLNADIVHPYGYFVDKETRGTVAPALKPQWRRPNYKRHNLEMIELFEKKTKLAAWFVSNCDPPSKRNLLVQKMQQFMAVDVYGKCGTLKCTKEKQGECRHMVKRNYKFYLSFENSICEDYVTEKVFSIMKYHTIPVVYGGADYNRILPPGSYINVADYESVEDLVKYLKFVANNREEYVKYFWWRKYYEVHDIPNYCALCEKIRTVGDPPKFTKYYNDLDNWFKNGTCFKPETIPLMNKVLKEFERT